MVLEGVISIQSGDNHRITADLVNAETDATLWSNSYDGTMNNIFALQDSISGTVAKELNVALLGKGATKPEQETDPEAYNLYLLGNHYRPGSNVNADGGSQPDWCTHGGCPADDVLRDHAGKSSVFAGRGEVKDPQQTGNIGQANGA